MIINENIDTKLLKKIAFFLLEGKSKNFLEKHGISWTQKQITGLNRDLVITAIADIYKKLTGRDIISITKTDIKQNPSGKIVNITGMKQRFISVSPGTSLYTLVAFEYSEGGKIKTDVLPKKFNLSCKNAEKTK